MITEQKLKQIAEERNINPFYQEKDYLQNVFLFNLSSREHGLVFKGGTCLKLCYNLPRYSVDLDFNTRMEPDAVKELVRDILDSYDQIGAPYEVDKEEKFPEEQSYTVHLRFQGPLYDGSKRSENAIEIDAGYRQGTERDPVVKQVASPYPDIPSYLLRTMDLQEILAEKIAAMSDRELGRDLFDVWFLLDETGIDPELVSSKLDTSISFPTEREFSRDLEGLAPSPPDYDSVRSRVEEALRESGIDR